MKWLESIEELSDGSNRTLRFKTKEDADRWLKEKQSMFWCDIEEFGLYPLSELEEVDTDSSYFWD